MSGSLMRRGKLEHKHTCKEECHGRSEAETGVIHLQAEDCQHPGAAGREAWKNFSLRTSNRFSDTLILDFNPASGTVKEKFL